MKSKKITDDPASASRRRYDDACGTAHALELVGDRWALLVVRELMLGPRRFGDLRADMPGISANVLTQRLGELEGAGVVVRRKLPPPASIQVYELTPWGYEAEPIVQTMGRWAARSPAHDPTLPLSAVSLMLSLRTMFDPIRAGDLTARICFDIGDARFIASIGEGRLDISRGAAEAPDARFTGTATSIAAAIYGGELAALLAVGALTLDGDQVLAGHFVTLFRLPAKVELLR